MNGGPESAGFMLRYRQARVHFESGVQISTRISWDERAEAMRPFYRATVDGVTRTGMSPEDALDQVVRKLQRRIPRVEVTR